MDTVDVVLFSHNHENFIERALRGVFEQETTAKIRIRVHDDASDDNTASLARAMLKDSPFESSLVVATENQFRNGSSFKWRFATATDSDFVAFLDADDFWVNRQKLEKQINLLKRNKDVALCHAGFVGLNLEGEWLNFRPDEKFRSQIVPGHYLSEENFIGTLTVVCRRSAMPTHLPTGFDSLKIDDYPLWALVTEDARIAFLDEIVGVYRIHDSNNFANLPHETQRAQLADAVKWISQSIKGPNAKLWKKRAKSIRAENRRRGGWGRWVKP